MNTIHMLQTYSEYPAGENFVFNLQQVTKLSTFIERNLKDVLGPPEKEIVAWVMGSSGSVIAAMLGALLKGLVPRFKINVVRKSEENSHSSYLGLTYFGGYYNVIIDDFISTGKTVNAIYEGIVKANKNIAPEIDGLFLIGANNIKALNFKPKTIICGRTFPKYLKSPFYTGWTVYEHDTDGTKMLRFADDPVEEF